MNKTVLAAIIGAGATITAAVIGVYAGRAYEQNIVQNQIEEVLGNNVNVVGDGNTITVNDIKSLAENYIKLQDQYDELQDQNSFLLGENMRCNENLQDANDKISELSSETDQEIRQLQSQISNMYNVDFQNISLTINGIDSGYVDRTATINNETFYSMGFLQYMVDNQAVSSDTARLFVGKVQSEEQMPVSLFDLKPFTRLDRTEFTTKFTDTYGNIYNQVIKIIVSTSSTPHNELEYYLDGKYKVFSFDVAFEQDNDFNEYQLVIRGDGQILKTVSLVRKSKIEHCEIDISDIEFLQFDVLGGLGIKPSDSLGIINPYLYP